MRKTKSLLASCLIGVMMLGSVSAYAAETVQTTQSTAVPSFSLDEVKTLVQKNSANRDAYDLQESIMRLTRKNTLEQMSELDTNSEYWLAKMKAAEAAGDMKSYNIYYSYYSSITDAYNTNAPTVEKAMDQINDSLDDLKRQMNDLPTDLDMTSTVLYTKLLELNDSRDLMSQNLNMLLQNRKIVQLQQQMGLGTDLNLANIDQQINNLTQSITTLDSGITTVKRTMNNLMGFDLDYQFNIKPLDLQVATVTYIPAVTSEQIETTLKNDLTLKQLTDKMDYSKVDIKNTDDTTKKATYKNDLKGYQLQYDNQVTTVKNNLNSYRSSLVDAQNAYLNAQNAYKIAQQNYNIAELKHNLGLTSDLSFNSEKITLRQSENALESAKYDLYFARANYDFYQKGTILTLYNTVNKM